MAFPDEEPTREPALDPVKVEIAKLRLDDGDLLVVRTPKSDRPDLDQVFARNVGRHFEEILKGTKARVLVLPGEEIRLGVVRRLDKATGTLTAADVAVLRRHAASGTLRPAAELDEPSIEGALSRAFLTLLKIDELGT